MHISGSELRNLSFNLSIRLEAGMLKIFSLDMYKASLHGSLRFFSRADILERDHTTF
jgi:hypothetical protein